MAEKANFVNVSPSELKFRFELKKNTPVTLTLQNPSGDRVAFKVKTTSPKKYCVRPSNGFVEPNSSKDVQVILQAQREMPASLADCKDKFLIQCVKLPGSLPEQNEIKEITSDLFDTSRVKDIRQTKLRVVLVAPPRPPSPVPEGNEEPNSPLTTKDALAHNLDKKLTNAATDKSDIRRRLAELEGSVGSQQQVARSTGAYGVTQLVLVALLAFVLGYFMQVQAPALRHLLGR
ncbi:hypothetical protein ACKKBG_A09935 [Auxenochlorella protothecoides x Auxenochlorella symbiontica]|uniref:Vesicle-associated protein 1-2 n=1 Tax=Auxenochlorella protothecoides TaxID=3075 RepID=A0A087SQL7_AUXPR|nr:Vesicle-associated protein 1-2 [Auxenochlorella protothecoides]KFM28021.1 Vesicle-associated protein 1-2 [Auxenochlorella protothecoides]